MKGTSIKDKVGSVYEVLEVVDDKQSLYDLLLLADETKEAIDKYLFDSIVFALQTEKQTVAVFCLYPIDRNTIELKNIAVNSAYQSNGIGASIIDFIKKYSIEKEYSTLLVGTSDTGEAQIRFYLRNGFTSAGIKENFFIENYPEPIFENGKQLKDMVMFQINLK
ncbi:MAG: GNAT family N-acetyltransferase [Flavobacteriaceae bacterium]|jgi:ribosomal protein S18 acetylase RimI-like enzyme|nr:GNAT family N-acetyltransferase [Flavobacteriaceae bacterium]